MMCCLQASKERFLPGAERICGSRGETCSSPPEGTGVLAQYADQFYSGKAAAVTRRAGKGSVTYIGVDSKDGELEAALMERVYQEAGAGPAHLPQDLVIDWRDGFWV